jgi:2-phosphoglycerate kinase
MPETIVTSEDGGAPYSKGLMAQTLSATGLAPERAYELARMVERRLDELPERRIDVEGLRDLAEEVIRDEEGEDALRRFHEWQRLDDLDRPLVVTLAGTTGIGKSTLATMLAHRLGITRVIPTDVIRQVLRAFFSHEFMPAVHYSSFEAGKAVELMGADEGDPDLAGFARQAESVSTGVSAIVERACQEGTPMVLEGVHLVPGTLEDDIRERCLPVEVVLVVEDESLHRGHFAMRGPERPADRYLSRFEQIRKLQAYLVERARAEGVPVIENVNIDRALADVMDLILDAVGGVSEAEDR